jgi:hypothetical protein
MDKFLSRNNSRTDEESVNSISTFGLRVSENDATNISVSNDTTVTISKSKAEKVRLCIYKDDYINFGLLGLARKTIPNRNDLCVGSLCRIN